MRIGWRGVVFAAGALWLAALAYSALSGRVLYGDGAIYVLVHFQLPHRFDDYDVQRSFASFLTQAPILLAERFEIERVSVYAAAYAASVFVLPAAAMLAALALAHRQPALFAAIGAGAAIFGFGVNYINSEANLFFGLVWLAVAILALDRPAPWLRGYALPLIGVVLLRTYEGMLLAGPLLAVWAAAATERATLDRERWGLWLSAMLFGLGAVIAFGGYLAPRDPANAAGFARSAFLYLGNPQAFVFFAALCVAPAIVRPRPAVAIGAAAAAVILGIAYVVAMERLQGYYGFSVYYQNRAFLALSLPVFLGALLAAYLWRPRWLAAAAETRGYALVLVPLLFAVIADARGTSEWNRYVDAFCTVLRKPAQPSERLAMLRETGARTAWSWTHPTLSVLLRDRGSDAMVENEPGQRWEPFPASRPPVIKRLGLCQAPLLGSPR